MSHSKSKIDFSDNQLEQQSLLTHVLGSVYPVIHYKKNTISFLLDTLDQIKEKPFHYLHIYAQ